MYSIQPTINRDWVLERVSQEEIMTRYTGVGIKINEKFKSPFREDNSPSCVYYYNKAGKLLFRDFGKGRPMDAFEIVCVLNKCTFAEALKVITEDFNLLKVQRVPKIDESLEIEKKLAGEPTEIQINPYTYRGNWGLTSYGLGFWKQFGINANTLQKFKIFQLESAYCNGKRVYTRRIENPGFAYWFGGEEYKLYFPYSKTLKFMQNTDCIQGLSQLPESGDLLVVTKSMKDVMLFSEFNVSAIAPQSEVHPFTDEEMNEWKSRFKRVVLVYDFDYTGVKNANKWRKKYGLEYAFVEGAKDFSDLYKSSPYHAELWVNKLING